MGLVNALFRRSLSKTPQRPGSRNLLGNLKKEKENAIKNAINEAGEASVKAKGLLNNVIDFGNKVNTIARNKEWYENEATSNSNDNGYFSNQEIRVTDSGFDADKYAKGALNYCKDVINAAAEAVKAQTAAQSAGASGIELEEVKKSVDNAEQSAAYAAGAATAAAQDAVWAQIPQQYWEATAKERDTFCKTLNNRKIVLTKKYTEEKNIDTMVATAKENAELERDGVVQIKEEELLRRRSNGIFYPLPTARKNRKSRQNRKTRKNRKNRKSRKSRK